MHSNQPQIPQRRGPGFFERVGERILLLLVGPLNRVPDVYARGRGRFVTTRAAAYATIMTLGLIVLNSLSGGPMFRAPVDVKLLALRLGSYWSVQFVVGALLSLFIWKTVERIVQLRRTPTIRTIDR